VTVMRAVYVEQLPENGYEAEQKAHQKTDEVDVLPIHDALLTAKRADSLSGPRTECNLSSNPVVSMIPCSTCRHMRESSCRAMARSDWLTRESRRNRCAPSISHRSSRSSSAPTSDISSVWNPSGSSTRYPGWTLKNRASRSRVWFVRCGR